MNRPFLFISLILSPFLLSAQEISFSFGQVLDNQALSEPWHLSWGPDDHLWLTERGGTVSRIDPVDGTRDELIHIDEVYQESGQDGLLGMALHPELGQGTGNDYVWLSYTYFDSLRHQKIVRYQYSITDTDGSLSSPDVVLDNLPSSNDHNSGRLIFGPDEHLYYTLGDQGANQFGNKCNEIKSQFLPTQAEVDSGDYTLYQGKILRMHPDGSIPQDNPLLEGARSHIFSYGHRNPQGLAFSSDGKLYSSEHGPKTDDEVNLIEGGANYGWPRIAGYQDDQAYEYCNYSTAPNCNDIGFSNFSCPNGATVLTEASFSEPFIAPLASINVVENSYDFQNTSCNSNYICWPTIAPSSIDIYESDVISDWQGSLLVPSLKRGAVYRLKLTSDGTTVEEPVKMWYTTNRYRDIAIHPNGSTFYLITDDSGTTSGSEGNSSTNNLDNPGTIIRFDYQVPEINDTSFTINRSAETGDLVGYVVKSGDMATLEIIAGNEADAFSLDNRGKIAVSDAGALQSIEANEVALQLRIDDGNLTDEATVNISIETDPITHVQQAEALPYVYPNPFGDEFTVLFDGYDTHTDLNVELFNLSAQKIPVNFERQDSGLIINSANLPSGSYILQVSHSKGQHHLRIAKY